MVANGREDEGLLGQKLNQCNLCLRWSIFFFIIAGDKTKFEYFPNTWLWILLSIRMCPQFHILSPFPCSRRIRHNITIMNSFLENEYIQKQSFSVNFVSILMYNAAFGQPDCKWWHYPRYEDVRLRFTKQVRYDSGKKILAMCWVWKQSKKKNVFS